MSAQFTHGDATYEVPWLTFDAAAGSYTVDPLTAPGFGSWVSHAAGAPVYATVCELFDVDPLAEAAHRELGERYESAMRTVRRRQIVTLAAQAMMSTPEAIVMGMASLY